MSRRVLHHGSQVKTSCLLSLTHAVWKTNHFQRLGLQVLTVFLIKRNFLKAWKSSSEIQNADTRFCLWFQPVFHTTTAQWLNNSKVNCWGLGRLIPHLGVIIFKYQASVFWITASVWLPGMTLSSITHCHARPEWPGGISFIQKYMWLAPRAWMAMPGIYVHAGAAAAATAAAATDVASAADAAAAFFL